MSKFIATVIYLFVLNIHFVIIITHPKPWVSTIAVVCAIWLTHVWVDVVKGVNEDKKED